MVSERFTERVKTVLKIAQASAAKRKYEYIGTEDILLGLFEGGGIASKVLGQAIPNPDKLKAEIEKLNIPAGGPPGIVVEGVSFSPRAKKLVDLAWEGSRQLGHDVIGTEHLLLGLLKDQDSLAYELLEQFKVKPLELRDAVLEILGEDVAPRATVSPAPIQTIPSMGGPCKHEVLTFASGGFFIVCISCGLYWIGVDAHGALQPDRGSVGLTSNDLRLKK